MAPGERLRALRKEKGLTLVDLAAMAEISYSYLSEIERGAKNPSLGTLSRLADALDVNRDEFLHERDDGDFSGVNPGEKLRLARDARAMTLSDVASRAGISASYLSGIERGSTPPTLIVLRRLARILHVPLAGLLSPAERPGPLGDRLRGLRERLGMTQAEVAERAGVSAALIGQIELGRVSPSLKSIDKIASALGVSSCYLVLEGDDVEGLLSAAGHELRRCLRDPNVQMLLGAVCTLDEREMRFVFEVISLVKRLGFGWEQK